MRKPVAVVAGVVVVAGVLAAGYDLIVNSRWVGGFELVVTVNATDDPPATLVYEVVTHRKVADEAATHVRERGRQAFAVPTVVPFDRTPLAVRVKTTGRNSGFGRSLHYTQEDALILIAEWPDGRQVVKVVDIPDGRDRSARAVTVHIP